MTETLVGLGRLELVRFVGITGGDPYDLRFTAGEWLAWRGDANTGDLVIVHPSDGDASLTPDPAALERHRRFHGSAAESLLTATWTPPPRTRRMIGYVMAVRYDVPRKMASDKAGDRWHHKLGDFGRRGGGDRSDDNQFWPSLHASLHRPYRWWIVRRRGNAYRLDDWLIG